MDKFVVFLNGEGYEKYQILAAEKYGATCFKAFESSFLRILFKIHNSWKLNQYIEIPLKWLWFKRCFNDEILQDNNIYFIFYESFSLSYSKQFLSYLKYKYNKSKFIFVFTNPPDKYNIHKLSFVKESYNLIITDVLELSEKYGFSFYDVNPISFPDIDFDPSYSSDVFFIGANKGRLPEILKVYEKFKQYNCKCAFFVTGVRKDEQKYSDEIVYNIPLDYDEVLKFIKNTKCILEIVQGGLSYYTFRVYESILFDKKLLTNNRLFAKTRLYSEEYASIIDDSLDVSSLLRNRIDGIQYQYKDAFSFKHFADYIKHNIQ